MQQDFLLGQLLTAVPPLELRHRVERGQDSEDLVVQGKTKTKTASEHHVILYKILFAHRGEPMQGSVLLRLLRSPPFSLHSDSPPVWEAADPVTGGKD